ncbi:hypothetical protein HK414_09090 [Ramlibacter terrae]|uniref:Uncharacterized protein n=1 Tax=Ramlibacter terrae TaxID=2732511 RepID=A0ABX6P1S9_9BURK|nr:hypothetical protein HK414_09090 [Ramlibacter terrae]
MRKLSQSLSFRLRATRKRKAAPVFERVTGAFRGYSIAAYACEVRRGSGAFTAFYKVCDGRPNDYWGAHCLLKGAAHGEFASPTDALVAADQLAHLAIGNLPTLDRLRCFDAARMFRLVGLDQWPRQWTA